MENGALGPLTLCTVPEAEQLEPKQRLTLVVGHFTVAAAPTAVSGNVIVGSWAALGVAQKSTTVASTPALAAATLLLRWDPDPCAIRSGAQLHHRVLPMGNTRFCVRRELDCRFSRGDVDLSRS